MRVSLFSKTKYDWPRILKEKSDEELNDFIQTSLVDIDAKIAAIEELKRRKIDPKKIQELSIIILNTLNAKKLELRQETIIDKLNKYSLFVQIAILPIFLFFIIQFIQNFDVDHQLLIFSGIVVIVIFNLFSQQKDLKKKKRMKEEEIKDLNRQIEKYEVILKTKL